MLQIKASADSITKNYPAEKLYLQTDKPAYAVGDTIWFKGYLFHAPTLALSAQSGILYMDIADNKNTVIRQLRFNINAGLCWGNIDLTDMKAGNYMLRAYTLWMQNFTADCFFYKKLTIVGITHETANQTTTIAKNAKRTIFTLSGILPAQNIPDIDVQFLPEGGSIIAGANTRIGFKALDKNGRGVQVSGVVIDSKNNKVATFSSPHLGMGSFYLKTNAGEQYTARVNITADGFKEYSFPAVKNSGLTLSVDNLSNKDSVGVDISATPDIVTSRNSYYLIGKARNIICYAAIFNFNNGRRVNRMLAKSLFPTGITHFKVMDSKGVPLNERLVFIDHHNQLDVAAITDSVAYTPNDSIALNIKVTDGDKKSVAGNFSVSVTDDGLDQSDSLQDNILTHIQLTSELKGNIEQPAYYNADNNESRQALDNLMLTQGWVNYDYAPDKKKPVYAPETEFAVKGKVINVFNKPVKAAKVTLLSKSPFITKDTVTNSNGEFAFHNFAADIDTPAFILNAVNKHNNRFNMSIVMNDAPPPPITWKIHRDDGPLFADTDGGLVTTAKNNVIRNQQAYLLPGGHVLKEVKIRAAKIVKDSRNLNGPGNADFILDEKDLEKAGKKNWLDILKEKIKGFREGTFKEVIVKDMGVDYFLHDRSPGMDVPYGFERLPFFISYQWYFIDDKPVKIIVDGISIGLIHRGMSINDVTYYLKAHSAEDIKGIELNFSPRFVAKYIPITASAAVTPSDVSFLEITTRSGNGPVIDNTIGTYLYKPLPISRPAQFYEPRYTITNKSKHEPDNRATIYWNPNINIDVDGKATFYFYAADKPSTYTIIIEGTDGNGNLGYKRQKITVKRYLQSPVL